MLAGTAPAPIDEHVAVDRRAAIVRCLRTLDLPWTGADRAVRRLHDAGLRHLLRPAALTALGALGVAGTAAIAFVLTSDAPVTWRATPGMVPAVLVLMVVAVVAHELGHALVLVANGRRLRHAGVRLHLGAPAFYVDSTEALVLPRRARVAQVLAGPLAEWLVAGIAALVYLRLPDSGGADLARRFVVLETITVATNLLPFAGLDGSWLLADATRELDPSARGRDALRDCAGCVRSLERPRAIDVLWAAYGLADRAVGTVLLLLAGVFWYATFGRLAGVLVAAGPAGVAVLVAGAVVLLRPACGAARPGFVRACHRAGGRLRFRTERKWRVAAMTALAPQVELAGLDAVALGVLAGRLEPVTDGGAFAGVVTEVGGRRIGLAADAIEWVRARRPLPVLATAR